MTIVLMQLQV